MSYQNKPLFQFNFEKKYLDEVKVNAPDSPGTAQIIAFHVWGILRGMETFSQLVYASTQYGDALQVQIYST